MRRFLIPKSEDIGSSTRIVGSDARHICNVLRMKPGDSIALFDGSGFDYSARIVFASPSKIQVSIVEKFPSQAHSPLRIILAQAFLKDRKMDTLVRQITELGVAAFIPFFAQRSVRNGQTRQTQPAYGICQYGFHECKIRITPHCGGGGTAT